MVNSVDPDQTAPLGVYTVCSGQYEPRSKKNGLRGFCDQVGYKPGCTATEDG